MTTRFTRLAAGLGAAAALALAPLAVTVALPAGVPGAPAVASAGPACMADPFSRACQLEADDERQRMNEENHERIEQQRQKHEEEHQQRMQDQQHESQCRLNSRSPGCPDAGKWSTGTKVLVGSGIGLLALIVGPFIFAAIAAGGWTASTIREIDAGGYGGDDDDDEDGDYDDEDYEREVARIVAQAAARGGAESAPTAPAAAPAPSTDPAAVLADLLAKRPGGQE